MIGIVVVSEQITNALDEVPQYESSFNEGDTGELHIYLQNNISQEQLLTLQHDILATGVVLTREITQDARIIIIPFKKAMPALLAIASAVSTISGFIIGYQLLKEVKMGLPLWGWAVIGGVIVYFVSKKYPKLIGGKI